MITKDRVCLFLGALMIATPILAIMWIATNPDFHR